VGSEDLDILQAMFQASPDAIVVIDLHGTIETASPAAEILFGYPREQLVGAPIEMLLPEALRGRHTHHREAYAADPMSRPMGLGLDLYAQRLDGSVVPVDVSLVPTTVGGVARVGAFVRDATGPRRGENLLRSVNEMSRRLLAGEPTDEMLALASRQARLLLNASVAWIAVHSRNAGEVTVAAADGEAARSLVGAAVPASRSLAARAMREGITLTVNDMSADPDVLPEARAVHLGPGVYVPMLAEDGPVGALVVARDLHAEVFDESEINTAEVFASAAAIVLALGSAREALDAGRIIAEHERIARDLHDTVIQRLFAIGMRLQAAESIAEREVRDRIRTAVDSIDEVIREIRETIFDLNRPDSATPHLRQQFREVAREASEVLGFVPRVGFRGPVEVAVTNSLAVDLISVLREALSNVGRHAEARGVDVVLIAADGTVTLSVADDGVGPTDGPTAGHGIANMAARARKLGGEMTITRRSPSGTLLQWQVPSKS
jgi:PAS domain S-box-containing protein